MPDHPAWTILVLALALSAGALTISAQPATSADSNLTAPNQTGHTYERTLTAHGTTYHVTLNTTSHIISVDAIHKADHPSPAGFGVKVDSTHVSDVDWNANEGETKNASFDLMQSYRAHQRTHNVTFGTFGGAANFTYNFTVPRKYEGRYLRPTITDVTFDRVNETAGRLTVTLRSDSRYYYQPYVQVWAPGVDGRDLHLFRDRGENVTSDSIILPVEEGEPFEGEIRMYERDLNNDGPINTQYEFYGYPGDASFQQVPYDSLNDTEILHSYEYRNDSSGDASESVGSDSQYKLFLGVLAGVFVLVIVGGVVVSNLRRRP